MCCGGRDKGLSSPLQGLAKLVVICPSSRCYWIKVLRAIKTYWKLSIECMQLLRLVQLTWSVALVPCIIVSQHQSGNTNNAKIEGYGVIPRYEAHHWFKGSMLNTYTISHPLIHSLICNVNFEVMIHKWFCNWSQLSNPKKTKDPGSQDHNRQVECKGCNSCWGWLWQYGTWLALWQRWNQLPWGSCCPLEPSKKWGVGNEFSKLFSIPFTCTNYYYWIERLSSCQNWRLS